MEMNILKISFVHEHRSVIYWTKMVGMNFHLIIVLSICITITKIFALPLNQSQELSEKIPEFQDKEKSDRADFEYKMRDFQIGSIYKPNARWFGYSGKGNSLLVTKVYSWPGARIPYIIDRYFVGAEYQVIMDAINDFHKYTCVRFVPYNGERAYIRITPSRDGCHSSIGFSGNYYNVYLQSPDCINYKGTVMHELMHVLGFVHEQSRQDRDDYVKIQWDNIRYGEQFNFYKFVNKHLNNYGLPYDFGSLMHYPDNAFSRNGRRTITSRFRLNTVMGQRSGFSREDIAKINRMYKCRTTRS